MNYKPYHQENLGHSYTCYLQKYLTRCHDLHENLTLAADKVKSRGTIKGHT